MTIDLNDLIYFENDVISEDGNLPMVDFNKRHKPHTLITGDFDIGISPCNHDRLIFFAAYPAKKMI